MMTDASGGAWRVTDNPPAKRYEAFLGDERVAVMEYIPLGSKIIATHTEVDPGHKGQGIGARLVTEVLQTLRDEGRLLQPLCPYVTAFLRRHPEWSDVVDPVTPH